MPEFLNSSHPAGNAPPEESSDFLSPENLARADRSVSEVFACMTGIEPEATCLEPVPSAGQEDERTAIVGYSGTTRGWCQVQLNRAAACAMASAMLGGTPVEDEASLDDAVGEICNMIAGSWRDRVPSLTARCTLTPPAVITGSAYKVHMSRPFTRLTRCYRFACHHLTLTLSREA